MPDTDTTTAGARHAHRTPDDLYGGIVLAAMLLMLGGTLQLLQGIVALVDEGFYVLGQEYMLELDLSTWGWVHVVWGAAVLALGAALLSGSGVARVLAVGFASVSILVNFAWLPYYPVWSLTVIAFNLFASWALVTRWPSS